MQFHGETEPPCDPVAVDFYDGHVYQHLLGVVPRDGAECQVLEDHGERLPGVQVEDVAVVYCLVELRLHVASMLG